MTFQISEIEIQKICDRAAETALSKAGLIKPQISLRQANKRYGRTRVNNWRKLGLITPFKQGNIIYLKVADLEKASQKNLLQ